MFEGSYLGDGTRIDDDARLECGICWWVYDPAVGDPLAQIPPGMPFSRLPEHWTCPDCEAPRHKFMVVCEPDVGGGASPPSRDAAAPGHPGAVEAGANDDDQPRREAE